MTGDHDQHVGTRSIGDVRGIHVWTVARALHLVIQRRGFYAELLLLFMFYSCSNQ